MKKTLAVIFCAALQLSVPADSAACNVATGEGCDINEAPEDYTLNPPFREGCFEDGVLVHCDDGTPALPAPGIPDECLQEGALEPCDVPFRLIDKYENPLPQLYDVFTGEPYAMEDMKAWIEDAASSEERAYAHWTACWTGRAFEQSLYGFGE